VLGCEDNVAPTTAERLAEAITIPSVERELVPEEPIVDAPPPIPGQLLEKLVIEREGSFALPEGIKELTMSAAVALGDDGLAFVGQAWTRGELIPAFVRGVVGKFVGLRAMGAPSVCIRCVPMPRLPSSK
jgi:hypothetical protein